MYSPLEGWVRWIFVRAMGGQTDPWKSLQMVANIWRTALREIYHILVLHISSYCINSAFLLKANKYVEKMKYIYIYIFAWWHGEITHQHSFNCLNIWRPRGPCLWSSPFQFIPLLTDSASSQSQQVNNWNCSTKSGNDQSSQQKPHNDDDDNHDYTSGY